MRREPEWVETEARHRADAVGKTWVEKVEIATGDPGNADTRAGAVGELAGTMRGSIARSEGFREEVARTVEEIERFLPPEVRRALGGSAAEHAATLDTLIDEGCEIVLAHLREGAAKGAD